MNPTYLKRLQCKHIPDNPILEFLLKRKGMWCNWHMGDNNVALAMPDGIPPRLVLAKMGQLINRGLVSGCTCGCRGDFEITENGEAFLSAAL